MITKVPDYHVGQVVKLDYNTFKQDLSKRLVKGNHSFVIVQTDPIIVCELSSQENKVNSKFPWNIPIVDWEAAGLIKPTHVKTDQYGEISPEDIFLVRGTLTGNDLNRVLSAFRESPQHYKFEWIINNGERLFVKTLVE